MIRYICVIALLCAPSLWSSAGLELPLDTVARTRLGVAQVARTKRIQEIYPGELSYITGTKGFFIDVSREHYGLFPRLSLLEKERLFMMFYLCDEAPLSQSEEIAIRAQVHAASMLAPDSDGSTAGLADSKEEVAYRDRYEGYCKRYLAFCSIAPRMACVNQVMTTLCAHLPDLTQNDRWFLRMHLFCLPRGAHKIDGPLEIFAKDPRALLAHGGGSWEGLKAYLEAQIVS